MEKGASVASDEFLCWPFVNHWRQMLQAANHAFGGIQWSPEALNLMDKKFYDVLYRYVRIPNPSPFKRCAAFAVAFMDEDKHPIVGEFERHKLKPKLQHIARFSSAILLYEYIRFSLDGATLIKENGELVKLSNPILVSEHSFIDIIHALTLLSKDGASSFHLLALLIEQLAYNTNPHASYAREN